MTMLDDDIDDLLRGFRADEGVLGDDARTRMWARIVEAVPDAPARLDALDPAPAVRRLPWRGGRPGQRALVAAAAVLVVLAVVGVALRASGPGGDPVTAGPTTALPAPRDLQTLADRVATGDAVVLGETPEVRYAHVVTQRTFQSRPDVAATATDLETWIDRDGSGVRRDRSNGEELAFAPGEGFLGALAPADAVALPDDPAAVVDAIIAAGGSDGGSGQAQPLVETLAYPGIPGPARAAMLRFLDGLGFAPVTADDLGPTVMRVEGPGHVGSTLQVDIDLRTGQVVASALATDQGGSDVRTYTEADLRADTRAR